MALVSETVTVTIKELGFSRVSPVTEAEWKIVNNYLLEQCK